MKTIDHKKVHSLNVFNTWLDQHRVSVIAWGCFSFVVFVVYLFLSDKDFSFILTLSSLLSTFCFGMIAWKIHVQCSMSGISLKMFECYLILQICRLVSILPFEGYLPYDKTGDWLYRLSELCAMFLSGLIVYWGRMKYKNTYEKVKDSFNINYLILPTVILALIFHPTLNSFAPADIAWTFALYLETIAALPQLILFQKDKRIEPFTSHFLAGQFGVKVLSFIFWLTTYQELNNPSTKSRTNPGLWVLIGQAIQLIVMCDFMYIYVKCVSRGIPVKLNFNENV